MPFSETVTDVDRLATSNIINQIVYVFLFLLSLPILIHHRFELMALIKKEKFFTIFIAWCLLSLIWSDYRFISVKRLFQIISAMAVCTAFLLNADSSKEAFPYLRLIFSIYVIISIFAVFLVPEAVQEDGAWRGLSLQKNQLGQTAFISMIVFFFCFQNNIGNRLLLSFQMVISLILLFGSMSATSIITFFILSLFALIFFINNRLKTIELNWAFSVLLLLSVSAAITSIVILDANLLYSLPDKIGKDFTMTGRTYMWSDIYEISKQHLLLGSGFGGFWIVDNKDVLDLFSTYIFLPNQSHLGYLDLLNETGIIGVIIFILMITGFFRTVSGISGSYYWAYLVFSILIINLTESTLFRQGMLTGNIFLLSYSAVFVDYLRKSPSR